MARVRLLFGHETEYGFSAFQRTGRVGALEAAETLVARGRARLPHLPGRGDTGIFLGCGSRFYVDPTGHHPELSGPECTDPAEVVRHLRAGDRLVARLAQELMDTRRFSSLSLFKCNVSYTSQGDTWGAHESYLHRCHPAGLRRALPSFLASRIVFAGAGGFDPTMTAGIQWTLSPRAAYLEHVVSSTSIQERALVHTKEEHLARDTKRLHLVCGESLCSELANWLKIGSTALVCALVELGLEPALGVELRSPIAALHTFARDPLCRVAAASVSGVPLTAIAIQRHYLALCESRLDDLPSWAPVLCREWRAVLDALERDPMSLADRLEWPLKQTLFARHAASRGIPWENVPRWSHVLLAFGLANALPEGPVDVTRLLDPRSPARSVVERLRPFVEENGLDWKDLPAAVELRSELFALDTRFGLLVPEADGLFLGLERAGILRHRLADAGVELGDVTAAERSPPSSTRARARGEAIQRLHGNGAHRADWNAIHEASGRRLLLEDPFSSEGVLVEPSITVDGADPAPDPVQRLEARWRSGLEHGRVDKSAGVDLANLYEVRGRYREARTIWRAIIKLDHAAGNRQQVAIAINNIGVVYLREGRHHGRAIRCFQNAAARLKRVDDLIQQANALANEWTTRYRRDGLDAIREAEAALDGLRDVLVRAEDARVHKVLSLLARLEADRGNAREAIELLERVSALGARRPEWPFLAEDARLLEGLRRGVESAA